MVLKKPEQRLDDRQKNDLFQNQGGMPRMIKGGTIKYKTAICAICALNIICPSKSIGLPLDAYKRNIAVTNKPISFLDARSSSDPNRFIRKK